MKQITEEEAYRLAGNATEFPIIIKEEDERTESAVTLKKFPTGYILGVSCDSKGLFKLFFSEDFDEINQLCTTYLTVLREMGTPFSDHDIT
jgi:hypothetical protein